MSWGFGDLGPEETVCDEEGCGTGRYRSRGVAAGILPRTEIGLGRTYSRTWTHNQISRCINLKFCIQQEGHVVVWCVCIDHRQMDMQSDREFECTHIIYRNTVYEESSLFLAHTKSLCLKEECAGHSQGKQSF